ncbi:hypothetical protein BUE93_09370 [Chromobacterium amazonense]|uniref:histidine kinase n=2 Tax=Chromobacterium amazonense TaxID=1382803 RepID=A0A2S9X5H6_9NEIS|nr:hypothetical protein BUE93_09370 [Chromobacterium amazonense]
MVLRFLLIALTSVWMPIAQAKFSDFQSALPKLPQKSGISLKVLQQMDDDLLRPSAMYPNFDGFPLPSLMEIYAYRQNCKGTLDDLPPAIRYFEKALCNGKMPPLTWFVSHPVHPLGGSYAWHYIQQHPAARPILEQYQHIRERPEMFGGLGGMSDDNLNALSSGDVWLWHGHDLCHMNGVSWQCYDATLWQPLADSADVKLSQLNKASVCDQVVGQVCVQNLQKPPWLLRGLSVVLAMLLLGTLSYVLWVRRYLQRERQFVLQMLTHELRTPIAGLGNVVEIFRQEFDYLPSPARQGFGRLADGVQRLRQLAEASRYYISSKGYLEEREPVALGDWLSAICERHEIVFCLERDITLVLPVYWLGLCLENLLNNARKHGLPPVRLFAVWENGSLRLTVVDAGLLPAFPLFSRKKNSDSMGIGLSIVYRIMKRLGGSLRRRRKPTTFQLELKCDDLAN